MSDVSQGDGWWEASDGKWYLPERHPDYTPPAQVVAPVVPTAQPAQTRSDAAHQKPFESLDSAPPAFSTPVAAGCPLPGSVHGWKPVRRKRADDEAALRRGALIGLVASAVAWVLLAGVQSDDSYYYASPYFSFGRIYPDPLPLLSVALLVIAVVTGWLVAQSATNSRAGLSAGAAAGSIFVSSLLVPLLAYPWWWIFESYDGYPDAVQDLLKIPALAIFYALVAVPMGVIGWLIGRPRPLKVNATASLNLNQTAASDELMLVLSGLRNQRVERPTLSTVSLRLRFFPGWAILLSLLLFPLGILAAIAAQREETGTIILNEAGQGTSTLQVRGLFDEAACTRIEAFLKQHAASKELS